MISLGSQPCDNKIADTLVKSSSHLISPSFSLTPWSDFTPFLRRHIFNLWSDYWNKLLTNFVSKFKYIVLNIPKNIWFKDFSLHRSSIIHFNRLRICFTLSDKKLNLNEFPFCTLKAEESICNLSHIFFGCPLLFVKHTNLINSPNPSKLPLILSTILHFNSVPSCKSCYFVYLRG